MSTTPEPFLRWAGGKRALAEVILSEIVPHLSQGTKFFEPFVGGGAIMFALHGQVPGKRVVINDANPDLVCAYRVLQSQPEELISALTVLGQDTSEAGYYAVRASRPADPVQKAARMIYLNRTCFNGLWRVNSSGNFNVPYGKLKNPTVCNTELLRADSSRLAGAKIREGSYVSALSDAAPGDVVYLDPPYVPLTATASFSKYAKDDFTTLDQYALAGVIEGLRSRGTHVILSNSDTPTTREIFGPVLELYQVPVPRSISAAAASRSTVNEVIGVSFTPQGRLATLPKVG